MRYQKSTLTFLRWTAIAFALQSCNVENTAPNAVVPNNSITSSQLTNGSVGSADIQSGAILATHMSSASIEPAAIDTTQAFTMYSLALTNAFTVGTATTAAASTLNGALTVGNASNAANSTFYGTLTATPSTTVTVGSVTGESISLTTQPGAGSSANYYGGYFYNSVTTAQALTGVVLGSESYANNTNSGTLSFVYGAMSKSENSAGGTNTMGVGDYGVVTNSNSGAITTGYGLYGTALNSSTGTYNTAIGVSGYMSRSGAGSVTSAMGVQGDIYNANTTSNIASAYGFAGNVKNIAAGTITTAYGLYADFTNFGTIGTYYGLYLGPNNGAASAPTINYGVYSADTTATNYFAGPVSAAGTVTLSGLTTSATPGDDYLCISGSSVGIGSAACTTASDRRLKKDITPIKSALDRLLTLTGVTFLWKDEAKRGKDRQIGLIAQDVKAAFPEAVHERSDGFLGVNYSGLIGPVVQAVKELYAKWSDDHKRLDQNDVKLSQLEKKVELENVALKSENQTLKDRLDKLEQALAQATPNKALTQKKGRKLASQ